jgi:methylmalonyl-CoA mutase
MAPGRPAAYSRLSKETKTMTELTAEFKALANYRPQHKVRFVTAASLFDGHDASINIMRRILQGMGAEVIHLGHNRSVDEIVTAALQEDAQGIAISSYQGGHVEYFKYMVDLLKARRRAHPGLRRRRRRDRAGRDPRAAGLWRGPHLQPRGRPAHGPAGHDRRDGDALRPGPVLPGPARWTPSPATARPPGAPWPSSSPRWRTARPTRPWWPSCTSAPPIKTPVLGITGTGGAGKSSLTDELVRRFRLDQDDALRIAVISIDPSRRKSGGALLGDRIRMNAIGPGPGPASSCARWPPATPAARSPRPCPTSSPPPSWPAST